METNQMWIKKPDIVLREETDDWALLFDAATGQVVGVNPVGAFIWTLIDGKTSFSEISMKVKEEFTGCPDEVLEEVEVFIASLADRGFIGKLA